MGPTETPEVDVNRIKTDLWKLTKSTQHVEDLCERMGELFTLDEWSRMSFLPDERLKCFCLYAKVIEDENQCSKLLPALEATGNSTIAERIKAVRREDNHRPAFIPRSEETPKVEPQTNSESPRVIRYSIRGQKSSFASFQALRIPQILQQTVKIVNLNDVCTSREALTCLLRPCVLLEELNLTNVRFHDSYPEPTTEEAFVVLPNLKSYGFICDEECSHRYTWKMIVFFKFLRESSASVDLLSLWQNKMSVCIRTVAMEIVMSNSTFFVKLPKEKFYDTPAFISYIPKEFVGTILRNLSGLRSVTCLLPRSYDQVEFVDLPSNVKSVHISGLSIKHGNVSFGKSYEKVQLEDCDIHESLLDNISVAFPAARHILLRGCRVGDCDTADMEIQL